jgi:hypothetical protein
LNVLGTENKNAAHLAADVVLARDLKNHILTNREHRPGKIAGREVLRPTVESFAITHHSNAPKKKAARSSAPGKAWKDRAARFHARGAGTLRNIADDLPGRNAIIAIGRRSSQGRVGSQPIDFYSLSGNCWAQMLVPQRFPRGFPAPKIFCDL